MRFRFFTLAFLIFALNPPRAFPHPHVFVDNTVAFVFDGKGLAGFRLDWLFDEMFSNMLIHDYDKNRNGKFEEGEIKEVKKGAFSNLKKFNYFTHVKINGKSFKVSFVKDFSAKMIKGRVVYQFFIPCHVQAISSYKRIKISVRDRTFYCSIVLMKDQISYENDSFYEHDIRISKNPKEAYYYGQVYPEEITFRFRRKSG